MMRDVKSLLLTAYTQHFAVVSCHREPAQEAKRLAVRETTASMDALVRHNP